MYGLKGISGLIVVNVDVRIITLSMDWSVVMCKEFFEVKEIINYIAVDYLIVEPY